MNDIFKGLCVYFLPLGFGTKRLEFFGEEVKKRGGKVVRNDESPSHVVVEDSVADDEQKCLSALKSHGFSRNTTTTTRYVRASWLSQCLRQKCLVDTESHDVRWMRNSNNEKTSNKKSDGDEMARKEEVDEGSPEKKRKVEYEDFICSMPSTSVQASSEASHPNQLLVDELEKLANAYAVRNDVWRSHAYRKAINAVVMHKEKIKSFQEVRNIPGIGDKMALKLVEIMECGNLKKTEEVVDEKTKVLDIFCKVWGAGPSTAEGWYAQGYRRLEDVEQSKKLTRQQRIGLKYYEDLLQRIPRKEVEEIFSVIQQQAEKVSGFLKLELVGSYRRGKSTCGDVDVMIVNSGQKNAGDILIQLTELLKNQGCLTDDLVNLESSDPENSHRKYFGIFKLKGDDRLARRLDLFVVPKCEEAAALVHYTGSALYNRNVRLWAAKKGMRLTEHGLYAKIPSTGVEATIKGRLLPTATEEDIFRELGLPFKVPEERDH